MCPFGPSPFPTHVATGWQWVQVNRRTVVTSRSHLGDHSFISIDVSFPSMHELGVLGSARAATVWDQFEAPTFFPGAALLLHIPVGPRNLV